jgi:uncharacterized protein (TIGR02145 family)
MEMRRVIIGIAVLSVATLCALLINGMKGQNHSYNQVIAEGDSSFAQADWRTAIAHYNMARKLDPLDQKAISRLDSVNMYKCIDVDGNQYRTVKIDNQIWMAENLRTTRYANGDLIQLIKDNLEWRYTSKGAYSYYNNDISNYNKYGALYNAFVVYDDRNVCPCGWHVPNIQEWEALGSHTIGLEWSGSYTVSDYDSTVHTDSRPTGYVDKLKSINGWRNSMVSSAETIGFNALPGGRRIFSEPYFHLMGEDACWWTTPLWFRVRTDGFTNLSPRYCSVTNTDLSIGVDTYDNNGLSIRCVRDAIQPE